MKYSYSWLKKISKTTIAPEKMADLLNMHSFEVESIEKKGEGLDKVVVGQIEHIEKHPNADKLQLTKVNVGSKKLDIVCGASNIKVDDKVPVALIGAKLSNDMEIKEAEIRGIKSFGMLCAEDELGLGKDHSGILILDKNAKIGESIEKILEIDEAVFEIKVLPDRAHDALSHIGVAREVAALSNKKIDPYYSKLKLPAKKSNKLTVKIEAKDLCPRYIGAVMTNIKVASSPDWVKNRLKTLGINPINNVVDATNFVMLELGQPLHAFDLDVIKNKSEKVSITVRKANTKEKITLLDGTEKEMAADDLVIANESSALALAGIMGGEHSGISDKTTTIILESANFNATNIRRSRTRLKVKTEASDRYEKDIDPNLCEIAMARVIEIIEFFGGKLEGIADVYPKPVKPWKIKLDLLYVNRLLGESIPAKQALKILHSLELETSGTGKSITVTIPTFRLDLRTQEDLIEEIGRVYGYEKIKSVAPTAPVVAASINETREFERKAKDILVGLGFSEVYNYSFYSAKDAELAHLSKIKHLELENPMNPEQAMLRTSLIPNLLKNIRENLKNWSELHLFEIGKTYCPDTETLPKEKNMLIGALVLEKDAKAESFYQLKGYVDAFFERLSIFDHYFDTFECTPEESPRSLWHEGRCANIKIEGKDGELGHLGEINPEVLKNFDIRKRVVMFEFDLAVLKAESETEREYKPLRKFPLLTRDISLIAPSTVRVNTILTTIQHAGGNLLVDADLFDVFDFEEKSETSFAFHLYFGADDRTLRSDEVDELMKKINSALEQEHKIKIRT